MHIQHVLLPYFLLKFHDAAATSLLEAPSEDRRCPGNLGKYGACECYEEKLNCVNAQFRDTDALLHANNHYKFLTEITFRGNNFNELPGNEVGGLFGPVKHTRLRVLNISANYIVTLHPDALQGMPSLRVLNLNNNQIVLQDRDSRFLTHTPEIGWLYLRGAFNALVNRTVQAEHLEKMFETANLASLTYLDLSFNEYQWLPYNLPCHFPSLTHLNLRQNIFETLLLNTSCFQKLETIDLSANALTSLTLEFRAQFAAHLPDYTLVLRGNPFHCDCNSHAYISWIRSSQQVRDPLSLLCAKASPAEYVGHQLMTVPLDKLDCAVSLTNSVARRHSITSMMIISLISIVWNACFLLRDRY